MRIPISSQVDKKHACVIMMNHSWLTLFLIHWRMTSPCQRNPTLSEMILIKDRAVKEQAPQRHYLRSPSFLTATKIRSLLWHPAHEEPSLEIILSLCLHNYCFLCDESYASCETLNYECGRVARTELAAAHSAVHVGPGFPDKPRHGSPLCHLHSFSVKWSKC